MKGKMWKLLLLFIMWIFFLCRKVRPNYLVQRGKKNQKTRYVICWPSAGYSSGSSWQEQTLLMGHLAARFKNILRSTKYFLYHYPLPFIYFFPFFPSYFSSPSSFISFFSSLLNLTLIFLRLLFLLCQSSQ